MPTRSTAHPARADLSADEVRCPACGEGGQRPAGEHHRSWSLFECPNCLLQHFWPAENPGAEWYEKNDMYCARDTVVDWLAWYQERALKELPVRSGRLLDVGCGNGTFVAAAQRTGFDAAGIDFSKKAIEMGKRRFGLNSLHAMSIEQFRSIYPEQTFDVVTAFEVLEHMDDVSAFLEAIRSLLAPGGHFVVSVPNRRRSPRLETPEGDVPPHHFTRWDSESMRRVLGVHGFRVERTVINPARVTMKLWLLSKVRLNLVMGLLQGAKSTGSARDNNRTLSAARKLMVVKDQLAAVGGFILSPLAAPLVRGPFMVTIARRV